MLRGAAERVVCARRSHGHQVTGPILILCALALLIWYEARAMGDE